MNEIEVNVCERAEDLVAFLYAELSDIEARKFERHMRECASCKTELASFGALHSSIVAWRDASLGTSTAVARENAIAPTAQQRRERPSALAALREFFRLSPIWMKGATVFASVLLCVLAALAVVNMVKKPSPINPTAQSGSGPDLRAEVTRLKQENALLQAKADLRKNSAVVNSVRPPKRNSTVTRSEYAKNQPRNLRRPLSRLERMELAADLRLLTSKDDDELDLGSDTINHP